MKNDIVVKDGITIPAHELEVIASRAGGPGGQHVNKTSSRITVRWNVRNTIALDEVQKARVLHKLASQLTEDGDLLVHSSSSRSQLQNKKLAFDELAHKVAKALQVPKKRMKSKVPEGAKQARLQQKKEHGAIKKMRKVKIDYD